MKTSKVVKRKRERYNEAMRKRETDNNPGKPPKYRTEKDRLKAIVKAGKP